MNFLIFVPTTFVANTLHRPQTLGELGVDFYSCGGMLTGCNLVLIWTPLGFHYPTGIKHVYGACCGAPPPLNGGSQCGRKYKAQDGTIYNSTLCQNVSEYLFWDGLHMTQKVYEAVAQKMWNGGPLFMQPISLKYLVEQTNKSL